MILYIDDKSIHYAPTLHPCTSHTHGVCAQCTPLEHPFCPVTDNSALNDYSNGRNAMFRVHLSIGVVGKKKFADQLHMPAQQQLFHSRNLFSRDDHNTHRLFIRYTWVSHEDRKIGDKSGSSVLFLACLGRTKRHWSYLQPLCRREGYNTRSCTRPSKIHVSAVWRCLRINLLRNFSKECVFIIKQVEVLCCILLIRIYMSEEL